MNILNSQMDFINDALKKVVKEERDEKHVEEFIEENEKALEDYFFSKYEGIKDTFDKDFEAWLTGLTIDDVTDLSIKLNL
jgi:4-alpha-glucanotransferase